MKNENVSMIVTGIVAPAASIVVKRSGQIVPQLTFLRAIPDVLFVASATVLALTTVKFYRLIFRFKQPWV